MPKVSIIVAVYNVNIEYLKKCLDSVLNQTLTDIEIIIIDDGSTTDCAQICDDYANKDSRIRLVHKDNEGVSIASNLGISMATGEYFTFVDDDDWIEPKMCEKAYEKAIQNDADAAIWLFQSVTANSTQKAYYMGPSERIFEQSELSILQAQILDVLSSDELRISLAGSNWCKLYNTKRVKENSKARFPERMMGGEDALFTFKAIDEMKKVVLFEDYLYYYRQNAQSYTKRFKPDMLEDELRMLRCFGKLVSQKNELMIPYCKSICNSYIGLLLNFLLHEENRMSKLEKEKYVMEVLSLNEYESAIKRYKELGYSTSKKIFFFFSSRKHIKIIILLAKIYRIKIAEKKFN